ncbi:MULTISPECIES: hypothetical protein [unclassified Neisseria]|uniref:hypothetical protein n=1 Tax=unclassified Neisseria TaxID=2623750 RepID=UPI0010729CA4|nr:MULTISPECIES: hypothetical protein [unclassified Neisseria]MBF0803364.1 hypothetical protein [Neisseria sp. 19428wB4_WF04]TFU44026.1 hypothetical protein E4T99_03180 [Neisseria sp. WF04]
MFKTERVPVTLFQSTDEGAPQLTAAAGSLKTILKACLVTGYGDKQALDWEAAFEDSSYIAFRSKHNKASRCWLSVNNQYDRAAEVRGFHEMTAKETGTKKFGGGGYFPLLSTRATGARWLLVGHGRTFCLLVNAGNVSDSNQDSRYCQILYFGDFNSLAPSDGKNCVLLKSSSKNYQYIDSSNAGLGYVLNSPDQTYNVDVDYLSLASSYDQLNSNIACCGSTVAQKLRGVSYPDPISGGFSAWEIFLLERFYLDRSQFFSIRGLFGGIMAVREYLPSVRELEFFDNLDDSGDRFVKFNTNDYNEGRDCFVLNTTAWEI